MDKLPLIGVTGYAQQGKDTLYLLIQKALINSHSRVFKRYAFADKLKEDLAPFILDKFNLDLLSPNLTIEQKSFLRPMLVAYGCMKRGVDPLFWVKKVDSEIKNDSLWEKKLVPVLCDLRFENEAIFLRDNYKLLLIKVQRLVDEKPLPPPNEEERINQPLVDKHVDIVLNIPTIDPKQDGFLNKLAELIGYETLVKIYRHGLDKCSSEMNSAERRMNRKLP